MVTNSAQAHWSWIVIKMNENWRSRSRAPFAEKEWTRSDKPRPKRTSIIVLAMRWKIINYHRGIERDDNQIRRKNINYCSGNLINNLYNNEWKEYQSPSEQRGQWLRNVISGNEWEKNQYSYRQYPIGNDLSDENLLFAFEFCAWIQPIIVAYNWWCRKPRAKWQPFIKTVSLITVFGIYDKRKNHSISSGHHHR